jgi:hypothetical protein
MVETLLGIAALAALFGIIIYFLLGAQEGKRVEQTLTSIYSLKEEIGKISRKQGSYSKGPMLPLLFASKAIPDALTVNHEKKEVYTPMGYSLDVVGRGAHFSIEMYGISPDDCYSFGKQIVHGNYFTLGNRSDDLVLMRINGLDFDDDKPLTLKGLENACTQSFSIDVIMAFR